jgi:hypothetical protein
MKVYGIDGHMLLVKHKKWFKNNDFIGQRNMKKMEPKNIYHPINNIHAQLS